MSGTQFRPDEEVIHSDEEPEPYEKTSPDVRQENQSPRIKVNWEGENHCSNPGDCKAEHKGM